MLRVRALSISLGVWRLSGGQRIWHRLRICWKHCEPSPHQRWELQLFQSKKEVMALLCFRGRWCSHRFVCQIITRIIKRIWIRLILHVWTRFCGTKLFWLPDQMPRHIPLLWGVEVGVADSEGKFAYNPVSFQRQPSFVPRATEIRLHYPPPCPPHALLSSSLPYFSLLPALKVRLDVQ